MADEQKSGEQAQIQPSSIAQSPAETSSQAPTGDWHSGQDTGGVMKSINEARPSGGFKAR